MSLHHSLIKHDQSYQMCIRDRLCSGITGDFFLTTSMLESRNFMYGRKRSISVNEGSKYLKKNTVEGYENIDNMILYLGSQVKKYPILEAIYLILYKNENAEILYNCLLDTS